MLPWGQLLSRSASFWVNVCVLFILFLLFSSSFKTFICSLFIEVELIHNAVLVSKWFSFSTHIYICITYIHIYIYNFSDSFPLQVITKYWTEFPVLYSRFLLDIYFINSSVWDWPNSVEAPGLSHTDAQAALGGVSSIVHSMAVNPACHGSVICQCGRWSGSLGSRLFHRASSLLLYIECPACVKWIKCIWSKSIYSCKDSHPQEQTEVPRRYGTSQESHLGHI